MTEPESPSVSANRTSPSPPPLVERLLEPFRAFAGTASSSGLVLIASALVALAWANSPWAPSYHHVWETPLTFAVGGWTARGTLHHAINDGLMAVFFLVVGLEIKREVLAGELKSLRQASLPMVAAAGGMLVPAAIYALVNVGRPGFPGWGIPMATDIAFALGVLALLGDRVPTGLKVFVAALAIVDDIGAVLVIAVFYSAAIRWSALALAGVLLVVAVGANIAGVRRLWAYGTIGLFLWAAMSASGVHATVAGVLLAMVIPVRTRIDEPAFLSGAREALVAFDAAALVTARDPDTTVLSNIEHHTAIEELETLAERAQPPLIRMEHALHGIVSFGIMPLFALANAGVSLAPGSIAGAANDPVAIGALLGLAVGKPLGIVGFSWLAVRFGVATLPAAASWRMLAGAGVLAGIGFTMALFIAGLAFGDGALLDAAKIGVIAASTLAGIAGWMMLRYLTVRPRDQTA